MHIRHRHVLLSASPVNQCKTAYSLTTKQEICAKGKGVIHIFWWWLLLYTISWFFWWDGIVLLAWWVNKRWWYAI